MAAADTTLTMGWSIAPREEPRVTMPDAVHLAPRGARRLDGVPPALDGELVRTAALEALAERWLVPVTTVVAGAGFGKSTVLAQAVRLHLAAPEGVEALVSCEPGDEDAGHLASAICTALGPSAPRRPGGAPPGSGDPLVAVLDALRSFSPVPVTLVLDDLHELTEGSSGAGLVAALVRRLPAHAHLVLAGRSLPPLPLARLQAAGRTRHIGPDTLAFTAGERAEVAGRAGRPVRSVEHLAGWPALVRLALSAPPGTPRRFLWDEVLCDLGAPLRRALLALCLLGTADGGTLMRLCARAEPAGVLPDEPCLDRLAAVPLVERVGADEVRAHPLWGEALARLLPAGEVDGMRRLAVAALLEAGAVRRAGALAAAAGDADLLAGPARALVRTTLAAFPIDTGARWLAGIGPAHRDRPELVLLDAARRQARSVRDEGVAALVDDVLARAGGDADLEALALSVGALAAHAAGDDARLGGIVLRARAHPRCTTDPCLRLLAAAADAALAELRGDLPEALAALESVGTDHEPPSLYAPVARFHVHLLLLAGRADDAVRLADAHLAGSHDEHTRVMPAFARWFAGDPGPLLAHPVGREPDDGACARFAFTHLAFAAPLLASAGDHAGLARVRARLAGTALGPDARDSALATVAEAAGDVMAHDEGAAAARFERHLARHPLDDPAGDLALRRFLAYGYVLSPAARAAWDERCLGPAHQRARAVARLLLDARRGALGRDGPLPDADAVLTALPLPWAVELAARACRAGHPGAAAVLGGLVERLGDVARAELRRQADGPAGDGPADGARRLLDERPGRSDPGGPCVRVEVLGPLRVLMDGRPVEHPLVRRARVRAVLAILCVERTVSRERLMDLLWPDLDGRRAAHNLRVTLTYLRRLLGQEATSDDSPLRVEHQQLRLVRSDRFGVDLWDLRDELDGARRAEAAGATDDVEMALGRAVALWRGEPLTDLHFVEDAAVVCEGLAIQLTDAALTLAERRLAEGNVPATLALVEQARSASPHSERAARLAIAAHLQRGDAVALAEAVARLRALLDDLGVEPEPSTLILLRQVARSHRLARLAHR
jgi:DNA-binding SARP family transcriptional activator